MQFLSLGSHAQVCSHWCFYSSFWVFDFQHHFSFGSIQAPFLCLRLTSLLDCLLIFFELFSHNYNYSIEFFTSSSMSFFIRGHYYRVCILGRRNISLAFHLVFICSCGVNLLMEFFFFVHVTFLLLAEVFTMLRRWLIHSRVGISVSSGVIIPGLLLVCLQGLNQEAWINFSLAVWSWVLRSDRVTGWKLTRF